MKIPEKKRAVKKDHSASSFKNQKHPESTHDIKEKSIWKPETPQVRPNLLKDIELLFVPQYTLTLIDPRLFRVLLIKEEMAPRTISLYCIF